MIINKSELIKEKQELMRLIDSEKDTKTKNNLVQKLNNISFKILSDAKKLVEESNERITRISEIKKPVVINLKKLKKDLKIKYEKVREEYALLQQQIKNNVDLKKEMRNTIDKVNNIIKNNNKMTEDEFEEITNKYLR